MPDIKTFIRDARDKGLSDGQIRKALASEGWDSGVVDAGLAGLDIPKASGKSSSTPKPASLSPVLAALHHVLLWFFTGSSAIAIIGVVASLSGYRVSSGALAAMIAVTLVTLIPYAALYVVFLRQARKQPGLVPGKVWSIITVCLHSVGAMAAAITAVVTAIVGGDSSVLISALLIVLLDLIVVVTYCFAAFAPAQLMRLRKFITIAHLPVLFVFLGTLFTMSIIQLGAVQHDESLAEDMASAVQTINTQTARDGKLPAANAAVTSNPEITYRPTSATEYEICGTFKTSDRSEESYMSRELPRQDKYVSDSVFKVSTSGKHCFDFVSSELDNSPF